MDLSSIEDFQTSFSSDYPAAPNSFQTFHGKVREFEQVDRQKLLNMLRGIELTPWKV